jgi:hypothetical protein
MTAGTECAGALFGESLEIVDVAEDERGEDEVPGAVAAGERSGVAEVKSSVRAHLLACAFEHGWGAICTGKRVRNEGLKTRKPSACTASGIEDVASGDRGQKLGEAPLLKGEQGVRLMVIDFGPSIEDTNG